EPAVDRRGAEIAGSEIRARMGARAALASRIPHAADALLCSAACPRHGPDDERRVRTDRRSAAAAEISRVALLCRQHGNCRVLAEKTDGRPRPSAFARVERRRCFAGADRSGPDRRKSGRDLPPNSALHAGRAFRTAAVTAGAGVRMSLAPLFRYPTAPLVIDGDDLASFGREM